MWWFLSDREMHESLSLRKSENLTEERTHNVKKNCISHAISVDCQDDNLGVQVRLQKE